MQTFVWGFPHRLWRGGVDFGGGRNDTNQSGINHRSAHVSCDNIRKKKKNRKKNFSSNFFQFFFRNIFISIPSFNICCLVSFYRYRIYLNPDSAVLMIKVPLWGRVELGKFLKQAIALMRHHIIIVQLKLIIVFAVFVSITMYSYVYWEFLLSYEWLD